MVAARCPNFHEALTFAYPDRGRLERDEIVVDKVLFTPFVAFDLLPDDLRADRAETAAVTHAGPKFGSLRRLPAQRSYGGPCIGNAFERKHVAFGDAADRALLRTRDVRLTRCTASRLLSLSQT